MDKIRAVLEAGGRTRRINKGEILFRENETAFYCYIIKKGKIKIVNIDEAGRAFIQDFFTDNMTFG